MDTDKATPIPKFCFYCSTTHVMSQVLRPKSVNKRCIGRATRLSGFDIFDIRCLAKVNFLKFQQFLLEKNPLIFLFMK